MIVLLLLLMEYPWTSKATVQSVGNIPAPAGYQRVAVEPGSFGGWLRGLPLKKNTGPLLLHTGRPKPNQRAHFRILDIDVGKRDLQQCADAVMRLRAEYLHSVGRPVRFNFTSGHPARWSDWQAGLRPKINGNKVSWRKTAQKDPSYQNFRSYLNTVFAYAGTHSLEKELEPLADTRQIEIGDVVIQGGFPGHAMLVVDVAENRRGERVFMLVQSYMPAQEIHVVRGPVHKAWYQAKAKGKLKTPEWTFSYSDFHRFP